VTLATVPDENKTNIRHTVKILTRKADMEDVQNIKTSELRYRRLFEAAQDGILLLDAKTGAITDVNPFLIHMLGYTREERVCRKEALGSQRVPGYRSQPGGLRSLAEE
jgi:PAS domain-containing protein